MYPSQNNHNKLNHFNNLPQTILSVHSSYNYNYSINASNSNNSISSGYTYQKSTSENNILQSYTQSNGQNQPLSKLQYFENEIKINIFRYVDHPLNLALTCRNWSVIAKDSYSKSEWLLENCGKGKANALFHAISLGPTFIDAELREILITRKIITPINNEETLKQIAKLPQQTASDPLINQLFNGCNFNN